MASTYRRRRDELNLILLIVAAVLLGANFFKYGSISWLAKNKDAIDALSSIAGCTLLLLAGMASYYRFFKGRLLSSRADVELSVSIHQTPEGSRMHAIRVRVRNVGSVPLWEPSVFLEVKGHGAHYSASRQIERIWAGLEQNINWSDVIDSGEATSFFTHEYIPKEVWAVTYFVSIRTLHGVWQETTTVSNNESPESPEEKAANPHASKTPQTSEKRELVKPGATLPAKRTRRGRQR